MAFWRKHNWLKVHVRKAGTVLAAGTDESGEEVAIFSKSDSVDYKCSKCDFVISIMGGVKIPKDLKYGCPLK